MLANYLSDEIADYIFHEEKQIDEYSNLTTNKTKPEHST